MIFTTHMCLPLARKCVKVSLHHGQSRNISLLYACYAMKYVNTKRYSIDDVIIQENEDLLAAKIIEKHGKSWHLFQEARNMSIVHTVSSDFDMYDGLAREFVLQFPQTQQNELKKNNYSLGSVAILPNGAHFIYYLVIRENWWDRGAYRPLRESLAAMRDHALQNDVSNIAMGRLGSQADGLNFIEVMKDVTKVFYNTNISLTVYARRT